MKIFAYSYREFDEAEYFQKFAGQFGVELGYTTEGTRQRIRPWRMRIWRKGTST